MKELKIIDESPSVSSPPPSFSSSFSLSSCTGEGILNWCSRWLQQLHEFIEAEGADFRSRLSPQDLKGIQRARFLFHSCSILPPLIYYWGKTTEDKPTKFPASISFTIRKGAPQRAQLLLWTAGWIYMFRIIRQAGSDVLQKFSIKMFLTGVWTTVVFRLGGNHFSNMIHFFGAGWYMVDHIVLLKILKTRPMYRKIFYGSFLCLLTSIGRLRRLEQEAKLPAEAETTTRDRAIRLARLPAKLQRSIFWWELLLMVSENMLFASFVDGMPSGLKDDNQKLQQPHELLSRKGETVPLEDDEMDEAPLVSSSSSSSTGEGILNRCSRWSQQVNEFIEAESACFHSRLSPRDLQDIQRARFLFHSCSILPLVTYYWGKTTVDKPTKFPASISFTVRKGAPKWAHLVPWTAGWYYMFRIIRRAGSDVLQRFSIKMFLSGLWTTVVFGLGSNQFSNMMHFFGAGLYMVDLTVLLKILKTRPMYRKIFYGSFLCLLASIGRLRRLEQGAKLPAEAESTTRDRAIRLARLPAKLQRSIFWCELLLMVSENTLLSSFVDGMPSGLKDNSKILQQPHELLSRKAETVPLEDDGIDKEEVKSEEFMDACDS
jgi:hypothetical protein